MPILWRSAKNHENIEAKVWESLSKEWKCPRPKPVYLFSLVYFELFTKKKSEYLDKYVASENKRVRYSMLKQLLGKNNVLLPQSLGEPECLAKKFNAFFVKKIETALISLPLIEQFKFEYSHTTTPDTFQVFYNELFEIISTKNFEQYGTEWCNTNKV